MRISENTKTYKLFSALQAGEAVSPAAAEKRFGIKNMSAEVSRIRQSGFAVWFGLNQTRWTAQTVHSSTKPGAMPGFSFK